MGFFWVTFKLPDLITLHCNQPTPLQVFVWEDIDDDIIDEYKTYDGHSEDILAMAAYPPKQYLATGIT